MSDTELPETPRTTAEFNRCMQFDAAPALIEMTAHARTLEREIIAMREWVLTYCKVTTLSRHALQDFDHMPVTEEILDSALKEPKGDKLPWGGLGVDLTT